MTVTNVIELSELDKLKAEKRLTAKVCKCSDCQRIGEWDNQRNNFYLKNGMCNIHYRRDFNEKNPKNILPKSYTELIRIEKEKTAKKCSCDGCENVGEWNSKRLKHCLKNGMCKIHYLRYKKFGNHSFSNWIQDGRTEHSLYSTWLNMKTRTTNKKSTAYHNYGGRGISVCKEWTDPINGFWQFVKDVGERTDGTTLDRFPDKNGNYEKGNVRWATPHQQTANLRCNNKTVGVGCFKGLYWYATLMVNGKMHRKNFKTEVEAIQHRKQLEIDNNILI